MSYQDSIGYLYGLQKFGMKFGLDNMRRLMTAFGEPHRSFRCVHVAGTNGKGSTSAMLESILRTGGLRTGLFTSPHLISFTERIRINGEEISEQEVVDLAGEVRRAAEGIEDFSPTFFEVVTTMAFLYFRKMEVDWAIIETGLGGRLDATNVIDPEVSVITMIDYDHREFLGETLASIAREKAGIIKEGRPVISAAQPADAMRVIRDAAKARKAPLSVYQENFSSEITSNDPEAPVFTYRGNREYAGLALQLAGLHQVTNASLAARTAEVIQQKFPSPVLDILKGLGQVSWPGRLEMVSSDPPVMIDGAHNPHAAETLARHLSRLRGAKYKRIILVLGVMADKDISGIIGPLLPLAPEIIVTSPAYGRAATPEALGNLVTSMGHAAKIAPTVAEAISLAKGLRHDGDLILITGSFYTIGEAREALGRTGILTRLRESA
ncbi:MAG: bifunctional folylpolyglutamate synthase/dihydrofolate synthase [Nitrospiraceae bacterium]|nr:bifunctional folylpolyglutamate synthase/dihydrofolate synthase [Nitrospiraceae bacterium]